MSSSASRSLNGLKILVVDDSKTIRRTAETLLTKEGCQVFTAIDGFDALSNRVANHTPEWAEPITWVRAEDVRAAVRLYARTKPSMMEWGVGIEHTPNCIQTVRSVSMTPSRETR